ncbi:flagellar protein FliS [Enterococcus sp. 8G7_MSG3316]|uniref:Flagellar protein FliS n=1 Tax=Candidatus Enterococcus testudinis TaxID=1834191 RepID=A0A242A219_9ENTE|nr:flagellar export chaperone FliS [Enterococcus sp. 8G7_MSG3316]OTN75088.1 flagellar protein FliS [Enterococcus sp. 8G7_MSG3316]
MNYQQMQNNYLQNQVMSASPNKLIEMLLQAAVKHVKLAQMAINDRQPAQAHQQLTKAQNIILELRYSLDTEQGGAIAAELDQLYRFMYDELVQANIQKDPKPTEHVAGLLAELLESWQTITQ